MHKQPIWEALTKPRFSLLSALLLALTGSLVVVGQYAPALTWPALFNTTPAKPLPILVNELLAHTDPPQKDTVELYNPNDQPVNIGGWYLSDAFDKPKKFKIPANTLIPAHGYVLLDPDDFDLAARFVFSAEGEEVYLFAADAVGRLTGYYHGFSFGASPNGVSFGRHTTSTGAETFPLQSAPTLGSANSSPQVGPVVLSAIHFNAQQGDDYLELTNITTATVPLFDPAHPSHTWRIVGHGEYAFPKNLTLNPGATLLVVTGKPEQFRAAHAIPAEVQIVGDFPPATSSKDATDATLILQKPDPPNQNSLVPYVEVDVVTYTNDQRSTRHRLNLNAYGNDPTNWDSRSDSR